jgi:hypothetical protein
MTVASKKGGALFPALFFLIGILFVGILGYVYRLTSRVEIVMLDEKGKVPGAHHP